MEPSFLTRHSNELWEFADYVASGVAEIDIIDPRLRITGEGDLETFYAPFEFVNELARVTIIGLTPGRTQARIALNETRSALKSGLDWLEAIERAKVSRSFGGPMRTNLTKMLNHIGLNKWLGIDTCLSLFTVNRSMAHHTSIFDFRFSKGS